MMAADVDILSTNQISQLNNIAAYEYYFNPKISLKNLFVIENKLIYYTKFFFCCLVQKLNYAICEAVPKIIFTVTWLSEQKPLSFVFSLFFNVNMQNEDILMNCYRTTRFTTGCRTELTARNSWWGCRCTGRRSPSPTPK